MFASFARLAAVLAVTLLALPAFAADHLKFDAAKLAADQAAGKSILVHVTAPWCPTCRAQKPIVESLAAKPEFKDFVVYDLDFDTGGEALRALKARSQSTLIVFKGMTETGRSAGDTRPESIEALLKTGL